MAANSRNRKLARSILLAHRKQQTGSGTQIEAFKACIARMSSSSKAPPLKGSITFSNSSTSWLSSVHLLESIGDISPSNHNIICSFCMSQQLRFRSTEWSPKLCSHQSIMSSGALIRVPCKGLVRLVFYLKWITSFESWWPSHQKLSQHMCIFCPSQLLISTEQSGWGSKWNRMAQVMRAWLHAHVFWMLPLFSFLLVTFLAAATKHLRKAP